MSAPDLASVLAEEREIMDGWAANYDAATISASYIYRLERRRFADWVASTLRRAGRDPVELSLLDVGCGTGVVVDHLAREGFTQLTGFDLSERMLEQGRARGVPGADWVQGSVEDHHFEPNSFDVFTAVFTVHHLRDPRAFFGLVEDAVRPGGWFFLLEYDAAAQGPARKSRRRRGLKQVAGSAVRTALGWKNRRRLAAAPPIERRFNPAHRMRSYDELVGAIERPGRWHVSRVPRGAVLPGLLYVLVEESPLDRALARLGEAVDRGVAPRTGGTFQWIAGQRRPDSAAVARGGASDEAQTPGSR